jgi:hypothetical protein
MLEINSVFSQQTGTGREPLESSKAFSLIRNINRSQNLKEKYSAKYIKPI